MTNPYMPAKNNAQTKEQKNNESSLLLFGKNKNALKWLLHGYLFVTIS